MKICYKSNEKDTESSEYKCTRCKDTGFYIVTKYYPEDTRMVANRIRTPRGWEDEVDDKGEPILHEELIYPKGVDTAYRCNCGMKSSNRFDETDKVDGIPKEYWTVTYNHFGWDVYEENTTLKEKMCDNFVEHYYQWKDNKRGLYISSAIRGSGKTRLISSIANTLTLKYHENVKIVTQIDYLQKQDEDRRDPYANDYPRTKGYWSCDVLIIDEFGQGSLSEAQNKALFKLIDHRYKEGKLTLFASNNALENISKSYDERILDRVNAMTLDLALPEEPIRQRKANKVKEDMYNYLMRS